MTEAARPSRGAADEGDLAQEHPADPGDPPDGGHDCCCCGGGEALVPRTCCWLTGSQGGGPCHRRVRGASAGRAKSYLERQHHYRLELAFLPPLLWPRMKSGLVSFVHKYSFKHKAKPSIL